MIGHVTANTSINTNCRVVFYCYWEGACVSVSSFGSRKIKIRIYRPAVRMCIYITLNVLRVSDFSYLQISRHLVPTQKKSSVRKLINLTIIYYYIMSSSRPKRFYIELCLQTSVHCLLQWIQA